MLILPVTRCLCVSHSSPQMPFCAGTTLNSKFTQSWPHFFKIQTHSILTHLFCRFLHHLISKYKFMVFTLSSLSIMTFLTAGTVGASWSSCSLPHTPLSPINISINDPVNDLGISAGEKKIEIAYQNITVQIIRIIKQIGPLLVNRSGAASFPFIGLPSCFLLH